MPGTVISALYAINSGRMLEAAYLMKVLLLLRYIYREHVNVCTEVKGTFGRWDKRPGRGGQEADALALPAIREYGSGAPSLYLSSLSID
jgi:hypothetical protein